jgi:16S rRNA C1402 (ribose-2'-O) methylase RsmI
VRVAKDQKGRGILISCHKFNEQRRIDRLFGMMKLGFNVTLVSDAGTPTISDPGYMLVNKCIEGGVQVHSIPGPSGTPLHNSFNSHHRESLTVGLPQ